MTVAAGEPQDRRRSAQIRLHGEDAGYAGTLTLVLANAGHQALSA